MFKHKTIVITGGTGSFGNALLMRLLAGEFKEVRIFSRDELKQEMMRTTISDPRIRFYIGDVRDRHSVDSVLQGADLVFHAAALKQVPSCEFFPMQAVMTNVLGSANVIDSAVAQGVGKVVCLGTDKAVYPANAMGMTKALMEKVALSVSRRLSGSATTVCSVRYGNVMYSRGSVIPLFVRQLKEGRPITVTDPRMTRFLLSLDDAIDLVLFAFEHGGQGEILVRKAPACTVGILADALERLFSRTNGRRVIGMRHGEKMYEVLASEEELRRSVDMGDYLKVAMDDRDLNYEKYFSEGSLPAGDGGDYTSHNTRRLSLEEVEQTLLRIPELRTEL